MLSFVDALAKRLRCIALQHIDRFLDEDGSCVEVRGDHVNGGAGSIHAGSKRLLDRIHATAELGEQRWMNVDDPVLERFHERLRMNAVVPRIDNQLYNVAFEEVTHRGVTLLR